MDSIASLWRLIERGKKGENVGTSTGLEKLDKIIGGVQPSRYYLIGAASSAGKSALVLYMMYRMLRNMTKENPIYFLYFSLEIGADVLLAKLMALYCAEEFGIYLTLNDTLSFEQPIGDLEFKCLAKAKDWLNSISNHIHILDKGLNVKVLYSETLRFMERYGTIEQLEDGRKRFIPNNYNQRVIGIIDHLSLVRTSEGRSLKQEMDEISSYMVTLKRKYLISWFVLMQQNRDASSMDRRKFDMNEPGLNDLKDSGSPAQDADVVIQIFYPFREKLPTYRNYVIISNGNPCFRDAFRSLIITKNRYGIANKVIGCGFYGSVGWWKELPPGEEIEDTELYIHQEDNIPCNSKEVKDIEGKDDSVSETATEKIQLNFKF